MSKSYEREQRKLWGGGNAAPSTKIADGLTTDGAHGDITLYGTDAEYDLKRQVLAGADGEPSRNISAGLTYGDRAANAARDARAAATLAHGNAVLDQEQRDRAELAARREADLLLQATYSIGEAAALGWSDPEANATAAGYWEVLSPVQRAALVAEGEVDEEVADQLHTAVWPAVAQGAREHEAQVAHAQNEMAKGLALMRISEERGYTPEQATARHAAVFAYARANGVELNDDTLDAQRFEDLYRASEVRAAEDQRAEASARFQLDVLNAPSTSISEGLKVLGPNGYVSTLEGGDIAIRPDYARAAARVLGGGNGDPMYDDADAIRAGVLGSTPASEDAEWRQVQEQAGELFSAAEEARIKAKLGES